MTMIWGSSDLGPTLGLFRVPQCWNGEQSSTVFLQKQGWRKMWFLHLRQAGTIYAAVLPSQAKIDIRY